MDYQLLAAEHAKDPDFTQLVSVPSGVIARRAIKLKLLEVGALFPIMTGIAASAKAAAYCLTDPDFEQIDLADARTVAMMNGLLAENVVTQEQAAAVQALATTLIPRWQALGLPTEPHAGDIAYALTLS